MSLTVWIAISRKKLIEFISLRKTAWRKSAESWEKLWPTDNANKKISNSAGFFCNRYVWKEIVQNSNFATLPIKICIDLHLKFSDSFFDENQRRKFRHETIIGFWSSLTLEFKISSEQMISYTVCIRARQRARVFVFPGWDLENPGSGLRSGVRDPEKVQIYITIS